MAVNPSEEKSVSMIPNLKKIYPSLVVYEEGVHELDPGFKWFVTRDNEIIGIEERQLDPKDLALLAAFMTPYRTDVPAMTAEEEKWRKAVDAKGSESAGMEAVGSYRFVYFSIKENQSSPEAFKGVIHELFPGSVPILWENGHEGILIEYADLGNDNIRYEEIIDILMSDLYTKIKFLVGPFREGTAGASRYHAFMLDAARSTFASSDKAVAHFSDAVPYLLVGEGSPDRYQHIREMVLQHYADDEETLRMIEVFTKYNLNVSETAKALHLHRNSLQYRLDRFTENTGIDIRKFHHAMAVYLALLV